MFDAWSEDEIEELLSSLDEFDTKFYNDMNAVDFAICIIQGAHERITSYIKDNENSPTATKICDFYYEAAQKLSAWFILRKDVDEILALVNDNIANYKCKIRLYISPVDGELKKILDVL